MWTGEARPHVLSSTVCKSAVCIALCLLATTSVLVGGNVVMVVFLVLKDAMLHFIVCGLGTTCRGPDTALCPCLMYILKDSGRIRGALT